jgi:purine-binding chemotaxis protein CheW
VEAGGDWSLLCRVDARLCALPLANVIETTPPLPVEPVPGMPDFVLGLSIIRGGAVPIVDAERLFGGRGGRAKRFVLLSVEERRVGLAVSEVVGVRRADGTPLAALPPLLRNADAAMITAIGTLDSALLMVLRAARIIPEEVFIALEVEALAS